MNLYFQFLTQNQTVDAVDLIQLPSLFLAQGEFVGTAKVSSEGVVTQFKFKALANVSRRLKSKRFHQAEVIFDLAERGLEWIPAEACSLNGVFTASPTSDLWLPCKNWSMAVDGTVGNRWRNAKSQEQGLTYHKVWRKPSLFEMVLELRTSASENEILGGVAKLLATAQHNSVGPLNLFGCCDAGGQDYFVRIEAGVPASDDIKVLRNTPAADHPKLGDEFKTLHPIVFGSHKMCTSVRDRLGASAKMLSSRTNPNLTVLDLTRPFRSSVSPISTKIAEASVS